MIYCICTLKLALTPVQDLRIRSLDYSLLAINSKTKKCRFWSTIKQFLQALKLSTSQGLPRSEGYSRQWHRVVAFSTISPQSGTKNLASDIIHKTERVGNPVLRVSGRKREAAGHTTQAHLCLATSLEMASEKRYVVWLPMYKTKLMYVFSRRWLKVIKSKKLSNIL